MAAADEALGPLLELIRGEGSGRTLVIMTGDHGEARGDHGELTHGLFAYEATLRVPLLLWCPGRIQPGRTARPARHVDILPTVLDLVGAPTPGGLAGASLLAAGAEGATYFESLSASLNRGWAPLYGVIDAGWKYVDLPIPELYDLKSDPEEKRNLAEERRDEVRKLKSLLPAPPRHLRAPKAAKRPAACSPWATFRGRRATPGPIRRPMIPRRSWDWTPGCTASWISTSAGTRRRRPRWHVQVLKERPTMSVAYEFLAFLLQQGGKDGEAASVLKTAIQRNTSPRRTCGGDWP